MDYIDSCLSNPSEEVIRKSQEIGWEDPSEYSTIIIEAEDWGELKRKIGKHREKNTVLVFSGGNEKLNRKAVSDPRMDIILHPGKGRKDSGFDELMARKASKNNVALGLDFSNIPDRAKKKVHILSNWRKNLRLCEKHDAPYLITTNADKKYGLRAPRDLEAFVNSLGYDGSQAISQNQKIVEKNSKKLKGRE